MALLARPGLLAVNASVEVQWTQIFLSFLLLCLCPNRMPRVYNCFSSDLSKTDTVAAQLLVLLQFLAACVFFWQVGNHGPNTNSWGAPARLFAAVRRLGLM